MASNGSDIRSEEQRGACPECGKEFVEPAGSRNYMSGVIRNHRRDRHGFKGSRATTTTATLTNEHYILPNRLREIAKDLIAVADEMDKYIMATSDVRERFKEYSALVDLAKKMR